MIALAIETSWEQGGLALGQGDQIMDALHFETERQHGKNLAPSVLSLLRRNDLHPADLDLICVDVGPGSYTGLRVGISFAKTFAWSRSLPLTTVTAPDAIAASVSDFPKAEHLFVVIDARWNELYVATFKNEDGDWTRSGEIETEKPDVLKKRSAPNSVVTGNGIEAYRSFFEEQEWTLAPDSLWYPDPTAVCELGQEAFDAGNTANPAELQPLYLRPSQADR